MKSLHKKPRTAEIKCVLAIALATVWGGAAQAADCTDTTTTLMLGSGSGGMACTDVTVNTTADLAPAVLVTGPDAHFDLYGTTTLSTAGQNARGIVVSDGGYVLDAGFMSITTTGNGAEGVRVRAAAHSSAASTWAAAATSRPSIRKPI